MQTNISSVGRKRRITGNILTGLGGLMLIGSACTKLLHVPRVIAEIGAMGFAGNTLMLIAIVELLSALPFLMPLTRSFGLLMVSAFMGGAIATHVAHGQPFIQPAIVLAILWLGTWLRHPEILWSFISSTLVTSQFQQANPASALERG